MIGLRKINIQLQSESDAVEYYQAPQESPSKNLHLFASQVPNPRL